VVQFVYCKEERSGYLTCFGVFPFLARSVIQKSQCNGYITREDHKNDLVFDNGAETITARRISIALEVQ